MQFRVLRLGLLQDRDVGVGVFPERDEVLICQLCFGGIAGESVGTGEAEMCKGLIQRDWVNSAMIQDFLELGCCPRTVTRLKVCLASHIGWKERRIVHIAKSEFITLR